MPTGEPIGVAFVEVRPETESFRTSAEQELRNEVGAQGLTVQGKFQLDGIDAAKRDVNELTREVQGISSGQQQLQFTGLDTAKRDVTELSRELQGVNSGQLETAALQANALAGNLERASEVNLRQNLAPAGNEVALLAGQAEELSTALTSIPEAQIAIAGIDTATQQTQELSGETKNLGSTLALTAESAGGLREVLPLLTRGESQLAAATAQEGAAAAAAADQESNLIRVRARRAASLGPLRLAGVGLGVGTAVFAATQALGQLSGALEVTGTEAGTFTGKMRNLASSLLSGDIVGAFSALTNNTKDYSREQLILINQTPGLSDALRQLGESANLARSAQEVLSHLAAPPQFLQTGLAREQAQGDVQGQIKVLNQQLAFFKQAEDTARQIATSVEQRNAILEPIFQGERRVRDQLAALLTTPVRGAATTRAGAAATGTAGLLGGLKRELDSLEREKAALRKELPRGAASGQELAQLQQQLAAVNHKIEAETTHIHGEQQRHVDEMQRSRFGLISGDRLRNLALAQVDTTELAVLERERRKLIAAISRKQVEADALSGADAQLASVNAQIEQTLADIRAEQDRHTQAIIEGGIIGSLDTTALENEAAGNTSGQLRSLQAEALMIKGLLPALKATDTTTSHLYEDYLNRLISLNSQIESLQGGITKETKRHGRTQKELQDDADQAFLASFDNRVHRANLRKTIAAATAGLNDDIAASVALQAIYKLEIAQAKKRIHDKTLRDQTINDLTAQLLDESQSETALRAQQRRERIDRQEESLDLDIQLAQARENTRAEIRAHEAKIKFLQERIKHTRARTNQRKQLRVEIAQEQAEIRRLKKETSDTKDEAASFSQLAFSFLQELQGFSSNLASNVLPGNFTLKPVTTATAPPPTPRSTAPGQRPPTATNQRVPSPFEHGRGQGTSTTDPQGEAAARLREQGGSPATAGQLDTLISVARTTNRLLGDIKRGVGHPEARTARELNRHRGGTVDVQ